MESYSTTADATKDFSQFIDQVSDKLTAASDTTAASQEPHTKMIKSELTEDFQVKKKAHKPVHKILAQKLTRKLEPALDTHFSLEVDFTTFDQQQTPSYGSQALDLAGDMQTFFTRPIEVESQGDPATLSYTSLKHFNVMTNRQELIKRDQIE